MNAMKQISSIILALFFTAFGALVIAWLVSTFDGKHLHSDLRPSNEKSKTQLESKPKLITQEKSQQTSNSNKKPEKIAGGTTQQSKATQDNKIREDSSQSLVAAKADKSPTNVVVQSSEAQGESIHQEANVELVSTKSQNLHSELYQQSQWHPIHFKPQIDKATNEQCLACHSEIISRKVRDITPAGLSSKDAFAWYQTLDTYAGKQQTFHSRHLTSTFARKVMNLKCTFCHQGSDPREEAPQSSATAAKVGDFSLRKMVNPSKTCLLCHGRFQHEVMEGVEGPWHKVRQDFEDEETRNGCLTCHQETFRTVRHQVNYLKSEAIEKLAKAGTSDVCYGCHGGRSWYRISYPYPRHPWPGMEDVVEGVPEWAKNRPTQSDPKYRLSGKSEQ